MRRALILVPLFAVPLFVLLLAGCGQPKKLVPDSGWRKGPIDYRVSEEPPDPCPRKYNSIPQEWQGGYPAAPEEVLAILSPGHGPMGNRGDQGECVDEYGNKQNLPTVNGKNKIQEDELNMALAIRLHAFLKRTGFISELIRTGQYGTEGDCPQLALFRKSPRKKANTREWCGDPGSKWARSGEYLSIRGRSDILNFSLVKKLCGNDPSCIKDVWLPNKGKAISRAAQIVRDHAPTLGIVFDPDNKNYVDSLKVVYISLHFNYVGRAANNTPTILAMYSDIIRNPNGKGTVPNPALTFQSGNHELDLVKKNYVTSLFEYMVFSTRSVLKEARDKTSLHYINVGEHVGSNPGHRPSGTFYSQNNGPPRGPLKGEKIAFRMNAPGQNVGTVTVVSGIDPDRGFQPNRAVIAIPNNVTLEVANYLDCRNVSALLRSLTRTKNSNFDPDVTPPDPTDPIDVAAEDIAHGLVEYYESYVPGFKQKACDNLKNSDWKDHMPDWCTSGGGGGGANVPDIDDESLTPSTAELPVGYGTSATLSFRNVGGSDLNYNVSSSDPVVSLGPPNVVPASVNNPFRSSQSGTLPPNAAANIPVDISCTTVGTHPGEVVIQSNDPDEPRVSLGFTVRCTPPKIGVEELPAYQTAFNYIAPAGESRSLLKPPFDFYEAGGKAKLEFELEEPEWLHLPITQGELDPGARFSELLGNNYGEVTCGAVGEQEGYVIVRSNDPDNPEIQIPVRLMCPELEVVFNPDTYDDNLGLLSGVITVHGADHLKEMYAREVSDGSGGKTVQYTEPRFVYRASLVGRVAYRWPVLHAAGDEYSPWDWSTFPDIPFVSWVNSWAFDDGAHQIEEFSLYRPGAFEEGDSLPRNFVAYLVSPAEYTITTTAPWGYAVNSSGYTERVNSYGRFQFYLHPGEKKRLNSELMTFDWDVFYYNSDGYEIHRARATAYSPMIGLGTRFLCRFSTVADADAATAPYVPDARPPDFWQLNIPYAGPKYHVAARWCYQSYSVGRSPEEGAPWWTGEEPEVVPAHDGY